MKLFIGANLKSVNFTSEEFLCLIKQMKNKFKGNAIQIFTNDPCYPWNKVIPGTKKIKSFIKKNSMYLCIHASFVINFCVNNRLTKISKKGYINNLVNADRMGASGCVLHFGYFKTKKYQLTRKQAIANFVGNIKSVIKTIIKLKLKSKVILETPSTKKQICNNFDEMQELYNSFTEDEQKYIKFCIDTAHIHSTGFDIRNKTKAKKVFDEWDAKIGLNKIEVIHFNDSEEKLNSGVDTHQIIGEGYIGKKKKGGSLTGFKYITKLAKKHGIPLVQETNDHDFTKRIKKIKKWVK